MQKNITFLKAHILLLIIVCLGAFLRVYQLDRYAIATPEAGHELLTAYRNYQVGTLPLQGVSSSILEIPQGPIGVWIQMMVLLIAGTSPYAQSLVFALFGVGTLIALYELTVIYGNKKTAYASVAFLAVFPLAVAHSRMPFHITLIPFFTALYLFSLSLLWEKYSLQKLLFLILMMLILFQLEITLFPLAMLIPFVMWKRRYQLSARDSIVGVAMLLIGLLPQISSFFVREATLLPSQQAITTALPTLQAFWLFGGRIVSFDQFWIKIVVLLGLGTSIGYSIQLFRQKKLPALLEITLVATILLIAEYVLLGSISEDYFPPFFILFAILLGYGISQLSSKLFSVATGAVIIFMFINTITIVNNNYFVENKNDFQYDSLYETYQIVHLITMHSAGKPYRLATKARIEDKYPSFFDNFLWIALAHDLPVPGKTGDVYLIESNSSPPPNLTLRLNSFSTKTIYKVPYAN